MAPSHTPEGLQETFGCHLTAQGVRTGSTRPWSHKGGPERSRPILVTVHAPPVRLSMHGQSQGRRGRSPRECLRRRKTRHDFQGDFQASCDETWEERPEAAGGANPRTLPWAAERGPVDTHRTLSHRWRSPACPKVRKATSERQGRPWLSHALASHHQPSLGPPGHGKAAGASG